ncbi:DNA modification methylase [Saccharomonospora marina XMU15]|uniref:Methyltransferase n=1 Tax=Saccharomonospora marina XMU15 TaxID=882083 RepID=H5WX69_9PSEU|nr:DNA methyltransferase [Saccharomonospora marina]EHR48343.1 DNA modification methylase [Saccharomonospora marina XMU15]
MTHAQVPNPAQPGDHRQEGTPVADDRFPRALSNAVTAPAPAREENPVDEPTQRVPRALIDDLDGTTGTPPVRVADDSAGDVAVSVWTTAQTSPAAQRKGRYTPESTAHPAKMLPAVATHAIAHYTEPGDLVLDPMCGIGTTLVEALHAGRRAVGIEYEPHWVDVARANLALAHDAGVEHEGRVFHGDARQIASLLPPEYAGQAALVVTSPPYGPSTHGQVSVAPGAGVQKYHHLYGNTLDRGNLANIGHHRLLAGFTRILAGLVPFLKPGGHIAITIRPWREHAELIDLPSQILACGLHAGLIPVERCVALLARAAEHDLVARGSFFQRDFIRKQREAGLPLHLISHEDVLIFRTALRRSAGSGISTERQDYRRFLTGRTRHAENPRGESGVSESWAA